METFKIGEAIIYQNHNSFEIGIVKRFVKMVIYL